MRREEGGGGERKAGLMSAGKQQRRCSIAARNRREKAVAPHRTGVRRDDRPSRAPTADADGWQRRRRRRLVPVTIFLKAACLVSGIPLRVAATLTRYILRA